MDDSATFSWPVLAPTNSLSTSRSAGAHRELRNDGTGIYGSSNNDFASNTGHESPYAMNDCPSQKTLTGAYKASQRQTQHCIVPERSSSCCCKEETCKMSLTGCCKTGHIGAENARTTTFPDQKPSKRKLHQVETKYEVHEPISTDRAFMSRSSPCSLNSPHTAHMEVSYNERSFLEWYPRGDATITYPDHNGTSGAISGLHTYIIGERSALIAQAFESSRDGQQLHLDCLDSATALPLVRYLYTGSYAPAGNLYDDVPTSLLLHCKIYRLGDLYDLADLKQQAQVNVMRQCEFGCSSPSIPIDLCKAITYAYEFLGKHPGLIENIIGYCVTCFLRHRLARDPEFQDLAYKLRPFHQDMCKEIMKREFEEDDTAVAIIQMPFEPYVPHTYASREDLSRNRLEDVVYHFHGAEEECESTRRKIEGNPEENTTTLPKRTKQSLEEEHVGEDRPEANVLPLALRGKRDGKSPVKPEGLSIKERRVSSTDVSPEQLKILEVENPVLKKMRQIANDRRARAQEKDSSSTTSTMSARCSHAAPTQSAETIVASSSRKSIHALADYQWQLRLLEQQNEERLLRARQEKNMPDEQCAVERTAEQKIQTDAVDVKQEIADDLVESPRAEIPADDRIGSDSEYDVVAGPIPVEELNSSDSETDADTVVIDPPTPDETPRSRTLSIAGSINLSSAEQSERNENNSDSDWDLV